MILSDAGGNVNVYVLPGRDSYEGSIRNGVTSKYFKEARQSIFFLTGFSGGSCVTAAW